MNHVIHFTRENRRLTRDGLKTQTRRLVKWNPRDGHAIPARFKVGDRCWMHEPIEVVSAITEATVKYLDDGTKKDVKIPSRVKFPTVTGKPWGGRTLPPEWARDWIEITAVRAEPLQRISEADALAEGVQWPDKNGMTYRPPIDLTGMSKLRFAADRYKLIWEGINGRGSWEKNPMVWVYVYKYIGDYKFK